MGVHRNNNEKTINGSTLRQSLKIKKTIIYYISMAVHRNKKKSIKKTFWPTRFSPILKNQPHELHATAA